MSVKPRTGGLDNVNKIPSEFMGGAGADSSKYLRGDRVWATPPGGGVNIKQIEIDFGSGNFVSEAVFTVVDADVGATSQILASVAREAPTNKDQDEVEMDSFYIACTPAAGQFEIFMKSLEGSVYGAFKVNYLVG